LTKKKIEDSWLDVVDGDQRRNEGLPEMQRVNQCGSLLFKIFIL
jgi:hypothetical protein